MRLTTEEKTQLKDELIQLFEQEKKITEDLFRVVAPESRYTKQEYEASLSTINSCKCNILNHLRSIGLIE